MVSAPSPVVVCPGELQLGDRELGDVALAAFEIANHGSAELLIDQVRTSCTCSGIEQQRDGRFVRVKSLRISPGEHADLVMRVAVQGTPGTATSTRVTFRTNDPARPSAAIDAVISNVTAGVQSIPTSVVLGTLPVGAEQIQVVHIFDKATQARAVDQVVSANPDRISVRLLPLKDSSPETTRADLGHLIGRIEVIPRCTTEGSLNTDIEVHLTGEPRPPTVIPVTGRVAAPFEVSPSTVVLPRASGSGWVYSGECRCRNTADKPFELAVRSCPDGLSVQVECVEGSAGTKVVRITWDGVLGARQPGRGEILLQAIADGETRMLKVGVLCLRKGE
jgi:hypothetical protein